MKGIYCIKNLDGRVVYVGQSINIKGRWGRHKKGRYENENYSYSVLEECEVNELDDCEHSWIRILLPTDNLYGPGDLGYQPKPGRADRDMRDEKNPMWKGGITKEDDYSHQWYVKNRERVLANTKAYYAKHRDRLLANMKIYQRKRKA